MDQNLVNKLATATTQAERQAIVLQMSLAGLATPLQRAISAAAVPHWFDFSYLAALIGQADCDRVYDELVAQTFVNHIPGWGYAIHERTRKQLLDQLWQNEPDHFAQLSRLAGRHCATKQNGADTNLWQAEEIYHLLVGDPSGGIQKFQAMATAWANFEQASYEDIEHIAQLAQEHIDAGRLSSARAGWVLLWQARLALLYNQPEQAAQMLQTINQTPAVDDNHFKAAYLTTAGDIQSALGQTFDAVAAWQQAGNILQTLNRPFDRYLVLSKIETAQPRTLGGLTPVSESATVPSFQNRLLDIVENGWIKGVLNNSLGVQQHAFKLPLSQSELPAGAARLIAHQPNGADQPVASSHDLKGLFEASGRSLLVLGAPGSGKTITLLQLLSQLITAARVDENAPVPLLFNLSSFGRFKGELADWLVEQAHDQYSLKRESVRQAIEIGQDYYLLFDGLDEIPDENGRRSEAVVHINRFFKQHPQAGFVVCSRIKDYRELDNTLDVHHAVVIQPLTNRQIETTFSTIGRNDLIELTEQNWRLKEALRSPLLVNLLPQVVAEHESKRFGDSNFGSIQACRDAIFALYAEKMVPAEQRDWVTFLASSMAQQGLSVFQVENLQPDWLPTQKLVGRYRRGAGGLLTVVVGAGAALASWAIIPILVAMAALTGNLAGSEIPFWQFLIAIIFYPLLAVPVGVLIGAAFGFGGATAGRRTTNLENETARAVLGGLIAWICTALFIGFGGANMISGFGRNLFNALIYSAGFVVPIALLCRTNQIDFRDQVQFRWPESVEFRRPVITASVITVALGFVGALLGGTMETGDFTVAAQNFVPTFTEILPITIMTGLFSAFGLEVLDTPTIMQRNRPGAGVTNSLKNAVYVSLVAFIIFSISGYLLDNWYDAEGQFLSLLLFYIFPPIFAWYGGMAFAQHWALRVVLSRHNKLPLRLVSWLNQLSNKGLLRRAGGSYIFRHRSLLEHFSNLTDDPPQN